MTSRLNVIYLFGVMVATFGFFVWSFTFAVTFAALLFLSHVIGVSIIRNTRTLANGSKVFLPLLLGFSIVSHIITLAIFSCGRASVWMCLLFFGGIMHVVSVKDKSSFREAVSSRASLFEVAAFLLGLIYTAVWCQTSISPWGVKGEMIVFRPWIDSFYHASWVQLLSDVLRGFPLEHPGVAGAQGFFYHTSQYSFPVVIKSILPGLGSLDLYLKVGVPLSFFMLCASAYCFGRFLKDELTGLLSVLAVMCLPGSNLPFFGNTFFNFHWLMLTHANLAFAISSAALATIFIIEGCRQNNRITVLIGLILGVGIALFKLQLLILLAPLFALSPAVGLRTSITQRILLTICGATLLFIFAFLLNRMGLPAYQLNGDGYQKYAMLLYDMVTSERLKDLLLASRANLFLSQIVFFVFIYCASFGIYGIFYLFFSRKLFTLRHSFHLEIFILGGSVVLYLLVAMWGSLDSRTYGNPEELLHRSVGWVQFITYVLLAAIAVHYFNTVIKPNRAFISRQKLTAYYAIGFVVLLFPFSMGPIANRGPDFGLSDISFSAGLYRSLEYIRKHGNGRDVMYSTNGDSRFVARALAQQRLYCFRTSEFNTRANVASSVKLEKVENVLATNNLPTIEKFFNSEGVRWLLLDSRTYKDKANISSYAQFRDGDFFVVDMSHLPRARVESSKVK